MHVKNFREEIRDELMRSPTQYCCYCITPKRGKWSCCSEVHFVSFADLYEGDQNALIQEELDTYENWSSQQ